MYMRKMRMALDSCPSSGVIPRVSPTVPMAEAVSKRQVRRGVALGRLPRFFCPEVYLNYLKKYDTIVAVQV